MVYLMKIWGSGRRKVPHSMILLVNLRRIHLLYLSIDLHFIPTGLLKQIETLHIEILSYIESDFYISIDSYITRRIYKIELECAEYHMPQVVYIHRLGWKSYNIQGIKHANVTISLMKKLTGSDYFPFESYTV